MEKTGKIAGIVILAVAFCFALVSLAQAGSVTTKWAKKNLKNKKEATSIPIWQITQDGTAKSVEWVDHAPNPRFAIYDPGTPEDETDDVVLDKETRLVWERSPSLTTTDWYTAINTAYARNLAGRKGWRLPTIEELASLVDTTQSDPALPSDHPFNNVQSSDYWSSTTYATNNDNAWYVYFGPGSLNSFNKTGRPQYVWCVRGGQGLNGY
jgi:hypothetical protein